MPVYFRVVILLMIAGMSSLPIGSYSQPNERRLIATAEIVSQKYCLLGEELYVFFTLRPKFVNHTDKVLVLDKQTGRFADVQTIAKSREKLGLRDYEYDPIFDSFGHDDPPHFKPNADLLRSQFILVAPGQSFESSSTIFVRYAKGPGAVAYGEHVLQLGFSTWNYAAKSSRFAQAYRNFGQLVTEKIYTEPIDFQIPRNPTVEKSCPETASAGLTR